MSNSFKTLVKNNLRLRFPIYRIKYEADPGIRRRNILVLIVLIFTIGYLSVMLGFSAFSMVFLGLGKLIPLLSAFIGTTVSLFFTVFRSGSELFAGKDYDLLMSLPVKTRTVVGVKCLVLWAENILWTFLCMLPMGLVYLIMEDVSLIGILLWWPGIFLISLLPTVVAAAIGSLITAISSRFSYSKMIGAVLSIAVVILVFFGSMQLSFLQMEGAEFFLSDMKIDFSNTQSIPDITIDTDKIIGLCHDQIGRIYPPAVLFASSVTEGDIVAFAGFTAFSIIPYALFIQLLSVRYKQINTALTGHRVKSKYKSKNQVQQSARTTLYKKELKRFFTSTPYLVNLSVGPVMCLVLAIVLCFFDMNSLFELMELPMLSFDINSLIPYAFAATLSMGCTTCVSISMEGKNSWLLKSLPVSQREIYTSKIWVNLTLTVPVALISAVIAIIAMRPGIINAVLLFIIPVMFSVFSSVSGILINIFFCKYDWEDETRLVKQSASSFFGLFFTSLLSILFGGFVVILPVPDHVFSFIAVLLIGAASFTLYKFAIKRPLP